MQILNEKGNANERSQTRTKMKERKHEKEQKKKKKTRKKQRTRIERRELETNKNIVKQGFCAPKQIKQWRRTNGGY